MDTMNVRAGARQPPDVSLLFGPAGALGPLNPASFGLLEELRRHVDGIKDSLRGFLSIEMNKPLLITNEAGEVRLDGDSEAWMAALEAVRATHRILRGTTARAFIRDMQHLLPDEAPEVIRLLNAGVDLSIQVRAWLAFMLDQDDDPDIQSALIPQRDADYPPSASVAVDLT